METDKKAIARLLGMPQRMVRIDRYLYSSDFPNEIKAWRVIGRRDSELRRYQGRPYYPAGSLVVLIDLATELLVKLRFPDLHGLAGLVAGDTRFRKPVTPENELLIQVKLLRNYKGRIGIFSGVIADRQGDIVAENISKGAIIGV